MKVGTIFQRESTHWMVRQLIPQENKLFTWTKVVAIYSQFGPQPIFPDDERIFFINKRCKKTGRHIPI